MPGYFLSWDQGKTDDDLLLCHKSSGAAQKFGGMALQLEKQDQGVLGINKTSYGSN